MPDAARTIDMDETRARIRELMNSDAPPPADDGEDEGLHGLGRGMAYLSNSGRYRPGRFAEIHGTGWVVSEFLAEVARLCLKRLVRTKPNRALDIIKEAQQELEK